ncbi:MULTISPECIES: hypothetical protein [Bacillati]|jgi:hypothetical protein|nr:hypothetical protein [Streptomyces xylophagus]MEE4417512.1 hypothetical protein [Klebsiella pneumoniae]DAR98658.1 MAG TPA: hypothetical protein [Caudoviricetes sp.]
MRWSGYARDLDDMVATQRFVKTVAFAAGLIVLQVLLFALCFIH